MYPALGQQLSNDLFRFLILAFTEVMTADLSRRINGNNGQANTDYQSPVIIIIQRHRVADP